MKKKSVKEKDKDIQLDLGFKNTPKNIFYKYKSRYDLWLAEFETRRFIRDSLTWFTSIISLSLIFTQIYTITVQEKVPSMIPIFTYYIDNTNRLAPKEYIYVYPVIGICILFLGILFSYYYYNKERLLSRILLLVMFLSNLSVCFILLKLVNTF